MPNAMKLLDVTVGDRAQLGHQLVDLHQEQAHAVDRDAERDHCDRCSDPGQQRPLVGEMIEDMAVPG
jgi:hypothetical protein